MEEFICDGFPNHHTCRDECEIYCTYEILGYIDIKKYCSNCFNYRLKAIQDVFGYSKGYEFQKVITKEKYLNLISLA